MPEFQQPEWSTQWVRFAGWPDVALAGVALLLTLLLIVWWRQQTRQWFRIVTSLALLALVLCIASYYLFVVPAFYAGCAQGCLGWRGFPRAFATVNFDGAATITALDFALNWLMLWLLWLVASVVWRLLALGFRWNERSLRTKMLFVLAVAVLPWALLPRFIDPPQPTPTGEALRLAINARRSAEFTYRITGLWVQQLALEDVRQIQPAGEFDIDTANQVGSQVCLRGYTYFYLPWRRYRIDLDMSGVTALSLAQLPLNEPAGAIENDGRRQQSKALQMGQPAVGARWRISEVETTDTSKCAQRLLCFANCQSARFFLVNPLCQIRYLGKLPFIVRPRLPIVVLPQVETQRIFTAN